jgi:AcrR family transcriptional regulator
MFPNIVFNKKGVPIIPSTTNGGEMSDSEQSGRIVLKPEGSGAAAPDRRVRRTRKLLHDAFISLTIEKGYEKTTIQDILDRADVGRSTFYAHFRDKAALLEASFDGMDDQLQRQLADVPATDSIDVALPAALLYEHAHQNQRVYRALCGHQGGALVQRHLRALIGDLLRKHLRPGGGGTEVPVDIAAEFYTSAALGLLVWWIAHDFCNGPAWLTATYRRLAQPVPGG